MVISALHVSEIPNQKVLVDAAKRAGVKRFIPSDWCNACVPGVMDLYDNVRSLLVLSPRATC